VPNANCGREPRKPSRRRRSCAATRSITATNGSAWAEAFPEIERLTLLGLSSLSAPHTDLVHGLLAATSLTVHVHFREGTGEYLRGRVPDLLAITDPGTEAFE